MKNLDMYFGVLQYIPSSLRQESINVGVAIHIPDMNYAHFYPTKNARRVAAFDDEYDKDYFKMVMDSLRYDIDYPVDNDLSLESVGDEERFSLLNSPSYLKSKTYYLATEFIFMPIQKTIINFKLNSQLNSQLVKQRIAEIKDAYLYYDKPKNARVTTTDVRSSFVKQLRLRNLKSESLMKTPRGKFSENPVFDFKLGNSLIKVQSFDYAREESLAKELKSTLFDLQNLSLNVDEKISIVVDDGASQNPIYDSFIEWLSKIEGTVSDEIKVNSINSFMSRQQ